MRHQPSTPDARSLSSIGWALASVTLAASFIAAVVVAHELQRPPDFQQVAQERNVIVR